MEDDRLAAQAAQGDEAAFTALVERYRGYIYTIAYKISLHEEDALDIAQNVLLTLYERIGGFDGRGAFRSWLAAVTANEARDFLRHPTRRETATEPEVLEEMSDRSDRTDRSDGIIGSRATDLRETLNVADRRRLVEAAMASLPPQQRAIFVLRFRESIGPKEIAERLSLPASQVRCQLHRAIARIREVLAQQQGELRK